MLSSHTVLQTAEIVTGKDYLVAVCEIHFIKAFISMCASGVLIVFGNDHTGILILMALWVIDTTTGVIYAISRREYKSSIGFLKGGVKLYIIGATFLTMTLLGRAYPELEDFTNITSTFFIINETYSIIENLNKLRPNIFFNTILKVLGSAEAKIANTINKLNQ